MLDQKATVYSALSTATALSTLQAFDFRRPKSFVQLPRLSYFQVDNVPNLYGDETEVGSEIIFQIDLWSKGDLSTYAAAVDTIMTGLDYERISSPDMYEEDTKIHHIPMRYRIDVSDPDF